MIVNRPLNHQEQLRSQSILRMNIALGGGAASCCSESLLVLLALSAGVSETLVSASGALTYLSYAVLPLGFIPVARYGVGKSKKYLLWVCGICCLLIALSCFAARGQQFLLLAGWVLLYFFRCASDSAYFMIHKNIASEKDLPQVFSRNHIASTVVGLSTALLIVGLMSVFDNKVILPLVLIAGCVLYYLGGWKIGQIIEPVSLKNMAAHPIWKQAVAAGRNQLLRKQLVAGCVLNFMLVTMVPANLLIMKQAYRMTDSRILLLSSIQSASSIAGAVLFCRCARRSGPQRALIWGYPLVWMLGLYWILAPADMGYLWSVVPFVLCGIIMVFFSTGLGNYFTNTIRASQQLGGSVLLFLITGGLTGLAGMMYNPFLFDFIRRLNPEAGFLTIGKWYFLITTLLLAVGIAAPVSLPDRIMQSDKPTD